MSENWTEAELKAAVIAYADMYYKELAGQSFVKKHYYQELASRFERTEKSFEFRMQNISYIYSLMGRNWVNGLKPAKNVGAGNAAILEKMICEVDEVELPQVAQFESEVLKYKAKKKLPKPAGIKEPSKSYSSVTNYTRDPKVKAWVLKESNGQCESCNSDAPFITSEGFPFLEVHHLKRLCDGGSDTISNAVAVCPNCHRELHYGINKSVLTSALYSKIRRLTRE